VTMKRDLIIAVLTTLCLTATLFIVLPTQSLPGNGYDPWLDTNDDGTINILDLAAAAVAFGSSGTPINKTALLLELETRVSALEKLKVVAAAFILTNGTATVGYNIKSSVWDAVASHYEIHIAAVDYYFSDYVTIVTSVGNYAKHATTASKNGNLIITIFNDVGDPVQGNFQFVSYEIAD